VLLGDAGVAIDLLESQTVPRGVPRRATDIAWGSWREAELEAYQKRCRRKAKRWNAKMKRQREKMERESREQWKRDDKRRRMDLLRREVPSLTVYVSSSVTEWWAMWTVLWIDIGWCMQELGRRGIATNRAELIKNGVTSIYRIGDGDQRCCGLCLAESAYLVGIFGPVIVRCIPCWMQHRIPNLLAA